MSVYRVLPNRYCTKYNPNPTFAKVIKKESLGICKLLSRYENKKKNVLSKRKLKSFLYSGETIKSFMHSLLLQSVFIKILVH